MLSYKNITLFVWFFFFCKYSLIFYVGWLVFSSTATFQERVKELRNAERVFVKQATKPLLRKWKRLSSVVFQDECTTALLVRCGLERGVMMLYLEEKLANKSTICGQSPPL